MQVFLLRKGSENVEEGFSRDEIPALLADKSNVLWVDLRGDTPEYVEQARDVMLNIFGFHPLTVEDCVVTRRQPKIEGFPGCFYFIVHGVKPGETNAANFATKELDGYLGENFVVTFHVQRFLSIKKVKQRVRSSTFIMERGAASLVHHLLDELVDLYMPVIEDYERMINHLEERIFAMRRNSNEVLGEIMDLRRSVARLKRISVRQLEVLYRMSQGEFPQIPESLLPQYRDVYNHLQRISDLSESYRDLVTSLFDIHFAVVGTRTNEVMKTLAVVSAIILPLSLIAGIFGMNFQNMPELRTENGYFVVPGFMAFLAISMLVYFWRLGWIFQPYEKVHVEPVVGKVDDDYEDN